MALYDYHCEGCKHTFEVIKPIEEYDFPEDCPLCDVPAKKVFLKAPRLNLAFTCRTYRKQNGLLDMEKEAIANGFIEENEFVES